MMNCLVIMPRIVEDKNTWYMFPLGIAYVSASMKKAGLKVVTVNLNEEEESVIDVLKNYITEKSIDIILTAGLSGQYESLREILFAAKKINERIITVIGGGIITSSPQAAMKALEFADYGIIGEGEITVVELCETLQKGESAKDILGIIYKDKNGFKETPFRMEIANLDELDMPDYEGFGYSRIVKLEANALAVSKKRTGVIIASRSCPFQCTFCFHSSGQKYRQRSLNNIFDEVDFLSKNYGVEFLFIADELFAYDIKRVKEFCERIKPYNIKWWTEFRVTDITEEMIKILKDANCISICYGLESMDDSVLKSMRKNINHEQIEKALKMTYDAGIMITGAFIFGDINETRMTADNTIKWWKEHKHYGISLNLIITYPGTYLYKYALDNKIITDEVEFIRNGCPTTNVSKLTQAEYQSLSTEIAELMQTEEDPENIKDVVINEKSGNIGFVGNCIICGKSNKWEDISLFNVVRINCKFCGKYHKVPAFFEVKRRIILRVQDSLKEGNQIAFWGISRYFKALFDGSKQLENEKIYLIDSSPLKRITSNKLVYGPEILEKKKINIIIIAVPKANNEIIKKIRTEYKWDGKIINIIDLLEAYSYKLSY